MNKRGELNVLLIPFILVILLLIGAGVFAGWAYMERADYKDNSDQKSAAAAEVARKEEGIEKDKAFAEAEKQPLTSYDGPSAFGSIHVEYPKTWSAYVDSKATGNNQPLNAYFNPQFVPSTGDNTSTFALRILVLERQYADVLKTYDSYVKNGKVTVSPYSLPKVSNVVGVRVDGLVVPSKKTNGAMIIMPLRDKTIQIWTENEQTINDFNNFILQNLTFVP